MLCIQHFRITSSFLRDKVTRVLLLWVNNHFTDFETDPTMMEFLERFEAELEAAKMQGETISEKIFSISQISLRSRPAENAELCVHGKSPKAHRDFDPTIQR